MRRALFRTLYDARTSRDDERAAARRVHRVLNFCAETGRELFFIPMSTRHLTAALTREIFRQLSDFFQWV